MKKIYNRFFFAVAFLVSSFHSFASDWNKNPLEQKVFIENKSQFDGRDKLPGTTILYGVEDAGAQIYFTKSGLTYRFDKVEKSREESDREPNTEADEKFDYKSDVVHLQWINANAGVKVVAENGVSDYFTYHTTINIQANGYKKLVYKNLYPNIDVEYIFHPQQGIKYSLILHPGADVSQVKMKWSNSRDVACNTDENGNIHIPTLFGDLIDHAPSTNYEGGAGIGSSFSFSDGIVSFKLQSPNPTLQTIIIDPWLTNPAMANADKIWEIESDAAGNAYILGGDSPIKVRKYNAAGVVQWTYNTGWDSSSWIGTLKTNPSGDTYFTMGSVAAIGRLNTSGALQWQTTPGLFSTDEYWALSFNCDFTQLIAGGTRLVLGGLFGAAGDGKAYDINMSNGSINNSITVAKAVSGFLISNPNEIRSMCSSPNGNYYFHTLDTIGELTSSLGINWRLLTTYTYAYGSPNYGFTPQPQHTIAATAQYLYTTNGSTITRRNIANGAIINSATIPGGGAATGPDGISPYNSGIDIDSCGNVYVGSQAQVHKFDAALNLISSANTPSVVYDVAVGINGDVLVCGYQFATAINMSACAIRQPICLTGLNATVSATSVSCNGQCNGTATATPNLGTAPYTYLWSNSQTGQTATGLCANNYSVTVTDFGGSTAVASVTVTQPPAISASATSTGVSCHGGNNGLATVTSSGASPFAYYWSTGGSTSSLSGLTAGNYLVTVTDANGCSAMATVNVSEPPPLVINVQRDYYVCTEIINVTLSASGGTSCSWTSGATLSDSTICDPVASPLSTTTYTVTVSNGTCFDTAHVTVHVIPPPTAPTITVIGDSLFVPSVYTNYQWYFNGFPIAGGNNFYYNATSTGTYSVYLTDTNGCRVNTNGVHVVINNVGSLSPGSGFQLFPNPATNELNISCSSLSDKVTISIHNVLGQIIYSATEIANGSFRKAIDISLFAKGVYFVELNNETKNIVGRFVKD